MVIIMSHWTVAKIEINNPDLVLLKQALEMLAKELNSMVVEDFIVFGYGHRERCMFAIPLKLPYGNGYGVTIKDGQLVVVVDDHGAPLSATEFRNKLVQYYTVLATVKVAQMLGLNIQNINEVQGNIVIDLGW
jgi:hypothetical protein